MEDIANTALSDHEQHTAVDNNYMMMSLGFFQHQSAFHAFNAKCVQGARNKMVKNSSKVVRVLWQKEPGDLWHLSRPSSTPVQIFMHQMYFIVLDMRLKVD